ncbi:hypothetical protein CRENBAI_001297 [Crenichthys baileyi]|uniref:Uncharacterized protein n=1 Tax=Crenichthys baileyi TaxID=28760 RepID=A0AAV9RP54_9TELE
MDQAERIGQDLNRSCYSASLWDYMFTRTDAKAGLSSDSESGDEAEEIDNSDCITLGNIPSFQLTLTQDEDDEESFGLVAEELKQKIPEAIAITTFEEDRESEWRRSVTLTVNAMGEGRRILHLGHSPVAANFLQSLRTTDGFFSSRKGVAGHENHRTS